MTVSEAFRRYFEDPQYGLAAARNDGLTDDERDAILAEASDEGFEVKP